MCSAAVVRRVNEKPPWVIAKELADQVACIRNDTDPQFKKAKAMVEWLPPLPLRLVLEGIGFVTDSLQLSFPLLGLEVAPSVSWGVPNRGNLRPRHSFCAGSDVLPRAYRDHHGCGHRKSAGSGTVNPSFVRCCR